MARVFFVADFEVRLVTIETKSEVIIWLFLVLFSYLFVFYFQEKVQTVIEFPDIDDEDTEVSQV